MSLYKNIEKIIQDNDWKYEKIETRDEKWAFSLPFSSSPGSRKRWVIFIVPDEFNKSIEFLVPFENGENAKEISQQITKLEKRLSMGTLRYSKVSQEVWYFYNLPIGDTEVPASQLNTVVTALLGEIDRLAKSISESSSLTK